MYVRPHLDFCDVIYHIPEKLDHFSSQLSLSFWMEKLERVQYHAALAVTGTWKGTNREKIYDELGWEPLWKRRWFRRLVQFYKIQNDLTPNYLKIPVPPTRSHLYGLRSDNVLNFIKCRTNPYSNTFYPTLSKSGMKSAPNSDNLTL